MKSDDQSLIRCVLSNAAATELEQRYEHRRRLWFDGRYGGSMVFDKLMEREVGLFIAYRFTDIPRFIQNAKTRGRLRHPNLIPIFDFGMTSDGLPWFTEPFIEARSLDELLRTSTTRTFPSLHWLLWVLTSVGRAVTYAHLQGICHCNLKPGKVLVDAALEEVFLIGGWQKPAKPSSSVGNNPPAMFGSGFTAAFAAPEQVRASPEQLMEMGAGLGVDVYGLGGILYHLLYGAAPNQLPGDTGSLLELLQMIATRQGSPIPGQLRPDFRSCNAKIVANLEGIARKALQSEPRQRFQNVSEMITALEKCLAEAGSG